MKTLLTLILLIIFHLNAFSEKNISFKISPLKSYLNKTYKINSIIKLRCVITNLNKKVVIIPFKENDIYHGKLPYPTSMSITVKYRNSKLLDDYSSYACWNQLTIFQLDHNDKKQLKYGDKITRIIQLNHIVGCKTKNDNFFNKKGYYFIQLHISWRNFKKISSNILRININ